MDLGWRPSCIYDMFSDAKRAQLCTHWPHYRTSRVVLSLALSLGPAKSCCSLIVRARSSSFACAQVRLLWTCRHHRRRHLGQPTGKSLLFQLRLAWPGSLSLPLSIDVLFAPARCVVAKRASEVNLEFALMSPPLVVAQGAEAPLMPATNSDQPGRPRHSSIVDSKRAHPASEDMTETIIRAANKS